MIFYAVPALLAGLQAGDELFVTELDRLGRSTGEAIVMMDELIRGGVALRVLALPPWTSPRTMAD